LEDELDTKAPNLAYIIVRRCTSNLNLYRVDTVAVSKKYLWALFGISAIVGASIWLVISWVTGKQEAWDSSYYFLYGIPIMMLMAGTLGFILPIRPWRWGITIVFSQALILILQKPMGNLLPLGLVLFGMLSLPVILAAYLGAFARNKFGSMG
jgi:hypothetical protein